ncbi:hypothetical protein OOK44_24415 [Streptomyces cellulosae]|uniref:hypothetical protein n=1 Tax=Streptomyces cellulosae TaxID=1968 RepID=UPI0022552AD4|nr:hypothetical protein [Streptomyces cellulosae]WTC55719.1 hypothetical protein OH715_10700 [Streptomyces cellulosae]
MRHLVESFAVGALRRGQAIEQFLGRAATETPAGVRWVSVEPTERGFVVTLHAVEDVGGGHFCDLLEFPPLDPDDEFGEELGVEREPLAAMALAENKAGAVRDRWVNAGVAGAEYRDYVRAGRPTT